MTKQEILDKIPEDNTEFVIQQMLLHMSKTEMAATGRILRRIESIIYKSWAKSMPFEEIANALAKAYTFETQKNDTDENLEINKEVRRHRHRRGAK